MKKGMMLLAMGLSLAGLASAATGDVVHGSESTPLTMQVNNFACWRYTNGQIPYLQPHLTLLWMVPC